MQFQVFDVDYVAGKDKKAIIRLFGRREDGKSVCCFVPGFEPYFYAELKPDVDIKIIRDKILKDFIQVNEVEIVKKYRPFGYQVDKIEMLKIIVKKPMDVRDVRDGVNSIKDIIGVHETDILFKNRFLADCDILPMGWVNAHEMSDGNIRKNIFGYKSITTDCVIISKDVNRLDNDTNADMKYVTFDIETMTDGKSFPTPDKNEILMITAYFEPSITMGDGTKTDNIVFLSKFVEDIDYSICSDSETGMLNNFFFVLAEYDFDIISGYNSHGFDVPYILERIKKLRECGHKINDSFGRDGKPMTHKQFGETHTVSISGRISIDMLPVVKEMYKLKQYNLQTVAKEVLGMTKLDVDASRTGEYWNDPNKIKELIEYGRVDSELVMTLITKEHILDKKMAVAKLSGTVTQDIFGTGQTIMIENLLLKRFGLEGRVVASKPNEEEELIRISHADELKGGEVLALEKIGLVEDVTILDYKSLYPTIMIANNLCVSTEVHDIGKDLEAHTPPSGGRFIKQHIHKGVVPTILEELLAERMSIKYTMKTLDSGTTEYMYLDARQFGIKILLNSFYGYTGYTRARMYSLVIANAVTSSGRKNILITRDYINDEIESIYVSGNNVKIFTDVEKPIIGRIEKSSMKHVSVSVTYGDTDSVFVIFNSLDNKKLTIDEYANISSEIARIATMRLPSPMELEFESYCKRGIMFAKKRYALYIFEREFGGWKSKMKIKGIETVRRDWCDIVTETLGFVLDSILKEGDIDKAIERVRNTFLSMKNIDVKNNKELFEKLILTKKFTKSSEEYANPQPHLTVVEKMKGRGIDLYRIGDRIPFVILEGKENMSLRSEDPDFAVANNSRLDMEYYIEKQLMPPMGRVFESILGDGFLQKWDYMHGMIPNVTFFDIMENGDRSKNVDIVLPTGNKNQPDLFNLKELDKINKSSKKIIGNKINKSSRTVNNRKKKNVDLFNLD